MMKRSITLSFLTKSSACIGTFFLIGMAGWVCLIFKSGILLIRLLIAIPALFCACQVYRYYRAMFYLLRERYRRHKLGLLEDSIPANHGATLAEVIKGIWKEKVEFLAFFSPDGQKLCEGTLNSSDHSSIALEYVGFLEHHPGCLSVHNHPNLNVAFSTNDLIQSVCLREARTIVVAPDFCFVMDFPKNHGITYTEIRNFIQRLQLKCEKNECILRALGDSKDYCANADVLVELQNKLNDPQCAISIMRCKAVAKHFGFDFWLTFAEQPHNQLLQKDHGIIIEFVRSLKKSG